MRIKCAYSGLELQITYFPGSLTHNECVHPVFYIPQKTLLSYIRKWGAGELTKHDSYLLYLALLNSTELVEFRTNARYEVGKTDSIIAQNMEALARIIAYSNIIKHPSFSLPKIAITKETSNLFNSNIWIQNWMDCYYSFQQGFLKEREIQKIRQREALLQTFIKNVNKPISHYAKILADWAAEAGDFPTFPITVDGKSTSCREYWKTIIIRCCKSESIFTILGSDLEELILHCEDNIEHGSIYSHTLMELLRAGQRRQQNYLGLGDVDLTSTTYQIIADTDTVEDAAKMELILSAPASIPIEGNYPSKIAFLRAKLKYGMKLEYEKQMETAAAISTASATITTDDGKEL